jgi:protein-tyrosine phosphatase
MAEGIARKIVNERGITDISIDSSGMDVIEATPATEEAAEMMKERGVDISSHISKQFAVPSEPDTLVLTMTKRLKERILAENPTLAGRTFTLGEYARASAEDIPDPAKGQASYSQVANLLEASVRGALERAHVEGHRIPRTDTV